MTHRQPNLDEIKKRNGVTSYTNFMKDFKPGEPAFPVKEDYLKEYLTRKIKDGKLTAASLKQYISSIKACNRAQNFGWAFDAITKESLDSLKQVYGNSDSSNISNSQFGQSAILDVPTAIHYINQISQTNPQESAIPNNNFIYDARLYLPSGIDAPNSVPLPTGVTSYVPSQSGQYNTHVSIPYNLSSLNAQSSLLTDAISNFPNICPNQSSNPTNAQELVGKIVDALGPVSDAHRKMICLTDYAQSSHLPNNPSVQELTRRARTQISEAEKTIINLLKLINKSDT
ncbi:hypothetical protein C2G38_2046947 [Gigaspora rosea]|uniref:Uncharacterized protein n=1 Tax=Gigaspora rosea TaxID=44941 RepID=A0A397UGI3_9GLOM|nr:hypothetical protein C2G38_2046947 [Gigaspora rosea]CAG8618199.1 19844_t:CDS:1 [Gigaspora rosea]